ncbi:hypothetical protein P355_3873 [Burkholderia cenocepacia KC-01]|nr:hypothetical protein P355_3873 [Burkholderia cenocepacia KC-01]
MLGCAGRVAAVILPVVGGRRGRGAGVGRPFGRHRGKRVRQRCLPS